MTQRKTEQKNRLFLATVLAVCLLGPKICSFGQCANLTPHQPSGWDYALILSTIPSTNISSSGFASDQVIYLDWAVINNGNCDIAGTFYHRLYIDGELESTYSVQGLKSNRYSFLRDAAIGPLSAGWHTFEIYADADEHIDESNEEDNLYTRSIYVSEIDCHSASVQTTYNGLKSINTDLFQSNSYRLKDICQPTTIRIRDYNSLEELAYPLEITSETNDWTQMDQRFGASVLWAAKEAYNYFFEIHGRRSFDNYNSPVEGYVNAYFYNSSSDVYYQDNASMSWTTGVMKIGLGSSGTLDDHWGTLDIIGHEYTHAVTATTAGLVYRDESGALNESFSDIFGEAVEHFAQGSNDWLQGGDRSNGPHRSLSDPNAFGDPDTYEGVFWCDFTNNVLSCTTNDNGGVHTNSGVQNYWFYLLSEGGNGVNDNNYSYAVSGIGIDKASVIAYRMLSAGYLTENSGYPDARNASIQAVKDLFGNSSVETDAVLSAWCAVGVGICSSCDCNFWVGAVNTNWHTPGNWSCGKVPDSTSNVFIGNGVVEVVSDAICNTLEVSYGVNLNVNPGVSFTVLSN